MSDLRLAVRMMVKQPGLALMAIVALALGIGLTTTMFSIVNGAILRGLPFPESERILHIAPFNIAEQDDGDAHMHSYAALRARQQSFEELAAFNFAPANVVGPDGVPVRYQSARVTANMLRLLGVTPMLGRDFRDEESRPGAAPVVLIGDKVWHERFGGGPDVVGRSLRVNGTMMTVVGVMPSAFRFPQNHDLWPALVIDPDNTKIRSGPGLEPIGRLKPGVSPEQAAAEMATIWRQMELEYPDQYGGYTVEVKSYIEEFIGTETVSMLYTMLAAVFGVLIIACVNVANLVLARAADRVREVAVRTAMGAQRWRVVRQMLLEVLVLAVVGATCGLAIAYLGITLFNRAIVDTNPPFWIDIRIDGTVLVFVTLAALVAAIVAGIVPAFRASRADLMTVMNDEGRGTSSLRMGRLTRGLVIVEMAVSFGLLVVSGLVIQSIANTAHIDLGFATKDVWTARVSLPEQDYPDDNRRRQAMEAIIDGLQSVPGAARVAAATSVPFGTPHAAIKLPGREYRGEQDYHDVHSLTVSAGFFDTLRIPIAEGRVFDGRDSATGVPAAIVNQSFVSKYFPGGAVGERVALATGTHQEWRTIVGVVPDLGIGKAQGDRVPEAIYLPMAQVPVAGTGLLVQTPGPPLNLTAPARDAVRAIDPNLPIFNVTTIEQAMHDGSWSFRVFGSLFMAFGAAALFLATVGLYGVMAFSVSRRTQEIGVRMAVGAAARDVLGMVLRQGLLQVAIGAILGIGLAALLGSALTSLFFGVGPYDPLTFVVIGAVLVGTGLLACLVPARRAANIDPMQALRHQ